MPEKIMGRPTRGVSGYTPGEIKALFNSEDKYKIGLRLYAVHQVSLGKPSRQLEELYDTSFKQILNWVERFERDGVDGLRDRDGRGRKPRLATEQSAELRRVILGESPLDHGYNSATWNGPLTMDWLDRNMGVSFKKAQIYNILKGVGLTYQKSKGFYPEADPEKQKEFKEELKKNS